MFALSNDAMSNFNGRNNPKVAAAVYTLCIKWYGGRDAIRSGDKKTRPVYASRQCRVKWFSWQAHVGS